MDIVVVPSLKSELMSSTALTPTHHKGGSKGIKMALGLAAAVSIPYLAPQIALSMGMSGVLSSAIVGAGLGAGVAALTDQNIAIGALGGAIGGGIGGYYNTPLPSTAPSIGPTVANSSAGLSSTAGVQAPSGLGAFTPPVAGSYNPLPISGLDNLGQTIGGNTFTNALSTAGSSSAPISLGQQLSSAGVQGPTLARAATLPPVPATQSFTTRLGNAFSDLPSKAGDFITELPEKLFTGENAARAAGELATMGIGNLLTSDEPNVTAEEKARMADLAKARGFQQDQINKQTARADDFYRQALNVNPNAAGTASATAVKNTLARANAANLRKLGNPNMISSAQRRNALDMARAGNTAFASGRTAAETKRAGLTASALGASPTGAGYAGNIAGDLKDADERYDRSQGEYDNYAGIVEPYFASAFGTDSAAERERKRLLKLG